MAHFEVTTPTDGRCSSQPKILRMSGHRILGPPQKGQRLEKRERKEKLERQFAASTFKPRVSITQQQPSLRGTNSGRVGVQTLTESELLARCLRLDLI